MSSIPSLEIQVGKPPLLVALVVSSFLSRFFTSPMLSGCSAVAFTLGSPVVFSASKVTASPPTLL